MTTQPIPYAAPLAKKPLSERFNLRLMIFGAALLGLVGVPAYIYVNSVMTGGIHRLADGYTAVDFKSMVTFPFDQSYGKLTDVPPQFRDLDGKQVQLVGEIAPTSSAGHRMGEFALVYSVSKCCYSGVPQIQHFVQAKVDKGSKISAVDGQVVAKGILHVDVTHDGGVITGVYHLEVQSLEPAS